MLSAGMVLANRYRVVRPLGGGGMKMVYLVEDMRLANRPCALAEMIDSFTDPKEAQAAASAFQREAEMLASLHNDHIVVVHDRFSEENRHYLVMEHVDGETLEQKLATSPGNRLDESLIAHAALQILDALDYLHRQNPPVVYRDLKPANAMITADGRVKLIDFGIARLFVPKKTATMVGTQGYAPPEQYEGKAEPRSDLYALGATMHHLLTGRDPATQVPFSFPPLRALRPDCDSRLADLVDESLKYSLDERITSAAEFRRRLGNITSLSGAVGRAAPASAPIPSGSVPTSRDAVTVTTLIATKPCPRCAREAPDDAVVCPYCSAQLKQTVVSAGKNRRWPLALAGLAVIFGVTFASIYYYEGVYLPQQRAIAESKAKAAARAAENARAEAKARAEAEGAAKRRAQLVPQLAELVKRLQSSKPGSKAEQLAREEAIRIALQMNPPPEIPANAQALFESALADIKSAATNADYRKAEGELIRGLQMTPWYTSGWTALADAHEGADALDAAAADLKMYLIAAPTAADTASVNARISQLEAEALQQRQKTEEQRKLGELKKQQQQKQAEIDREHQAEIDRQQHEQELQQSKANLEVECRKERDEQQTMRQKASECQQQRISCFQKYYSESHKMGRSGNDVQASMLCHYLSHNSYYPSLSGCDAESSYDSSNDPCKDLYEQFGERL